MKARQNPNTCKCLRPKLNINYVQIFVTLTQLYFVKVYNVFIFTVRILIRI